VQNVWEILGECTQKPVLMILSKCVKWLMLLRMKKFQTSRKIVKSKSVGENKTGGVLRRGKRMENFQRVTG